LAPSDGLFRLKQSAGTAAFFRTATRRACPAWQFRHGHKFVMRYR